MLLNFRGVTFFFFFASFIFCKITAPGNGYISHRMGSSENHRLGSVLGGDMLVPRRATGLGDPPSSCHDLFFLNEHPGVSTSLSFYEFESF